MPRSRRSWSRAAFSRVRAITTLSDTYDGFVDEVLKLAGEMEQTRFETEQYLESLEGRMVMGEDPSAGGSQP